ncbi:MAG TPA: hypothetical protein DEA44_13220 [Firmicutes bacterium]|nr:hypothetical protein [Bacillota bacterium]
MDVVKGNGICYKATFDVVHYQKTGEIIYTSPRQPCETSLAPEIISMLQNGEIGAKRLKSMLDKDKFLHIANQLRMTDNRLAVYFGCTPEVIRALKKRFGMQNVYN